MAVKFIIDSASDVLPGECKKLDVVHVPLTVRFGDKEFADAVDLSHKKFYKMLTSGKEEHPTTSQVTPAAWAEAMEEATKDGDTAVVISVSSKLSGTYQSAMIAAQDYPDNVYVVDTLQVANAFGIISEYALFPVPSRFPFLQLFSVSMETPFTTSVSIIVMVSAISFEKSCLLMTSWLHLFTAIGNGVVERDHIDCCHSNCIAIGH